MKYDVKDLSLAEAGRQRIEWAGNNMPVLATIRKRFRKAKPLKGQRLSACLHVTTETANLAIALKEGWAAARLYPTPGLRAYEDIDLYVRPEQYDLARSALAVPAGTPLHPVDLHQGFGDLGDRSP